MPYNSRDEIDERYLWNLASIFESDEAFEAALGAARAYPAQIGAFQGKIAQDPAELLAFLKLSDEVDIAISKLATYAQRKSDEDTRISKYQAYTAQVMALYTQIASSQAWFSSELLTLSEELMESLYAAQPALELYRRALDREFRMREHVLSAPEEAILAASGEMAAQPENIYSLFNDADVQFEDAADAQGELHSVTHGSYVALMMSPDRTLRKNAFKNMYASYEQFRNTCAATLNAQVKQLQFYATTRKFPNTLAYCLEQTEVPQEIYTNLIDTVNAHMEPMYRYVALRKKVLGVDELHFYDLYVPIVEDVEMEYTYEQACELICEALAPMGEEYLAIVRKGLSERWVDVYETPGKRSGAYSAGGYDMQPVILMNFQGKLDDVFTLIHEMGHSVHTYLSSTNQPACYCDYVIFVAEVASTCNEALLTQYLLAHEAQPRKRAYILNHFLEQFRSTIYRQTMFAEFELDVNRLAESGEAITPDALCDIYRDLNKHYFGPDIVLDEEIAVEWARIPHFYYQYYVYQYSTGFAAAIALSQRILQEGPAAVQDYLTFLKGGCSKAPIELLKGAGVDMSSPKPVEDALAYFDQLVTEMEQVL